MPKRSACNLRSLNTSPVPLARISELNQARSLRCSVRGTGSSGMPLQRGGSGRKALLGGGEVPAVAAVLSCPQDSALFPPRVRRSRFSGEGPSLRAAVACGSAGVGHAAAVPWRKPRLSRVQQADGSRSPAVHCYPHFSMLCRWEARCTDWIPLGSGGGAGPPTEAALASAISYVP